MLHVVSGMNILRNFADLSMMSPCHCHLILHHFIVSFTTTFIMRHFFLSSTPGSNLTFSINPFHRSLPHLFGLISRISGPLPFFLYFFLFSFSCLIRVLDYSDFTGFSVIDYTYTLIFRFFSFLFAVAAE